MQSLHNIPENSLEPSISFLAPIGYQLGDCGYCKQKDKSNRTPDSRASYYATSKSISVELYQILVDRGWRRSGTLFYKPDPRHSCCPHYTIRLPADQFRPRKDQRQAVNRWNRYVLGDDYHKQNAKLRPKTKAEKSQARTDFDLIKVTHESESKHLQPAPPEPAHHFEVTLEPDDYTDEKFELYKNYQQHVHHDPPSKITPSGFKRFLCSSPLLNFRRPREPGDTSPDQNQGQSQKLGSFHQCYRLDGRLIAMGVLDLLPHSVSGVYFLYHSDFERFSFGKISALREAALALEGGYKFYYMGYYIHGCAKMKYKNEYRPQYILDLETMGWDELDEGVWKLLDENHYLSVSQQKAAEAPTLERKVFASAPEATDAIDAGLSLFDLEFAGMTTAADFEAAIDVDKVLIHVKKDMIVQAEDLYYWSDWSIHDSGANATIKGAVAQLLACTGVDVAKEVVVSFVM